MLQNALSTTCGLFLAMLHIQQEYLQSLFKQFSIIVIQWFAFPCSLRTQEQAHGRSTDFHRW